MRSLGLFLRVPLTIVVRGRTLPISRRIIRLIFGLLKRHWMVRVFGRLLPIIGATQSLLLLSGWTLYCLLIRRSSRGTRLPLTVIVLCRSRIPKRRWLSRFRNMLKSMVKRRTWLPLIRVLLRSVGILRSRLTVPLVISRR